MTASFQRRAANSKFETESSERQAPDQEAASKKSWAARTKLRRGQQTSKRQLRTARNKVREASLDSKKRIVEKITINLQQGRRSDWLKARNSKPAEQQSAWSQQWSADERSTKRKFSVEQRAGNIEQHVAGNNQPAVCYKNQNDSDKERTEQRVAGSE